METLTCQACAATWERKKVGGAKPRWCPECAPAKRKQLQKEAGRRFYEKDPEAYRAYYRAYWKENRDKGREHQRKYDAKNRDKKRKWATEYLYGVPLEDLEALRATRRCAMCGDTESQHWAIDHDHNCCPPKSRGCGKCIRGLLCVRCNTMVGYVEKDGERMRLAFEWAERNPRLDWSTIPTSRNP